MSVLKEITKEEFKKIYFQHPDPEMSTEAVQDYWDTFYGKSENASYFYEEPPDPVHSRMTVVADFSVKDYIQYRIFFRTEEEEELSYKIGRGTEREAE